MVWMMGPNNVAHRHKTIWHLRIRAFMYKMITTYTKTSERMQQAIPNCTGTVIKSVPVVRLTGVFRQAAHN